MQAVLMAVVFVGSRMLMMLLLGRPEGPSMLLLAVAYSILCGGIEKAVFWRTFFAFLAIGLAACMSIGAVLFIPVVGMGLLIWPLTIRERIRLVSAAAAGTLLATAVFFACWQKDLVASWGQFLWFLGLGSDRIRGSRMEFFPWVLTHRFGFATGWVVGLFVALIGVVVPVAISFGIRSRSQFRVNEVSNLHAVPMIMSALYGVAGLAVFIRSTMYAYYICYLSPWVMIGLIMAVSGGTSANKISTVRLRQIATAFCLALAIAWLPSAFWNVMRVREAVIYSRQMALDDWADNLRLIVPEEACITGDHEFFVVCHKADRAFEPLPFFLEGGIASIVIEDGSWLMLSSRLSELVVEQRPDLLAGRQIVLREQALSTTEWFKIDYLIYGPRDCSQEIGGPHCFSEEKTGGGHCSSP